MASIKVLLLLLVLAVTSVVGQYRPITGAEERRLRLRQDPELLALAARTGESIIIVIDGPSTTAIAQEGVNVNMDCLPWLDRFPGGSIQWSRIPLDLEGNIDGMEVALNPGDPSIIVGGPFNRWLNITRTIISASALTADTAIYMCEVCIARGTPFEECHTANVTLYIIGGPPFIDKAPNNTAIEDTPAGVVYMIGADFCIPLDDRRQYTLTCDINSNERTPTRSRAFPTPDRAWFSEGELLYRAGANDAPPDTRDFLEFFMDPLAPNRILLAPDSVFPSVLQTRDGGGLQFNLQTENLTLPVPMYPMGVTADNFQTAAFQAIVGEWTCEANNTFGMDTATSVIRLCGDAPVIPGCSAETIFGTTGDIVPSGCNVCIPEGNSVTLDCSSASESPVSYRWTDDYGNLLSTSERLRVSVPGNYTCTALNVDNPSVISATALFYSDAITFSGDITERFSSVPRQGNGCDRLRNETGITADFCVFVGETLDLDCVTDDDDKLPLLITTAGGARSNGTASVTNIAHPGDEGTYSCRLSTDSGPCGGATQDFVIQVFEPARINRVDPIPGTCTYGAGRPFEEVIISDTTPVTLCCPISGIEQPMTAWYRVSVDEFGMGMETLVEEIDGTTITESDESVDITFNVNGDATFVCRTSNNAGSDADIITIRTEDETGVWRMGEFSRCDIRCRDGVRRRSVTCRSDRDGMILPDTACPQVDIPDSAESCVDEYPDLCLLDPVWISSPWSECNGNCRNGFRKRDVVCQVPMTGEIKPRFDCNKQLEPHSVDFLGCRTCCIEDVYPNFCRGHGSGFCGQTFFQQFCCWTCKLTVIP